MAIDQRYIPAFSIEDVILDKDTGAPLSGGQVYFEQDNQRGVLKPIFQITGASPNYTYTQLPNPMTLSSIGTFEDAMGNPVVPYFFPYDGAFNPEYYYVRVESADAVEQFTREAVPYIPLESNSEVLSVITNEISNPQFAQVLFDTTTASTYTYTISAGSNQVISIAPDWDMIVSCPVSGTVTLGQLTPTGSQNLVTNPGTILNINSSGLTKLQLRQRIYGSPNLWGSGYISGCFLAKTYGGSSVILNMYYSQSNGIVVDQQIVSASLDASGAYDLYKGSVLIPISNSSNNFPTAYVDIYLDIPLTAQIDITSIMIAATGDTSIANINYDQESLARQIDHLYHYSYPIIPIGGLMDFAGFTDPLHYYLCDGAAKNRISDYLLFTALTKVVTVTLTNASPTFTVVSTDDYHIGMALEGIGIPASTTVSNIVGTTITMSNNATASGSTAVRLFAWGAGDGSTTFNVPDLLGYTTAGANGSLFYTTAPGDIVNGVGLKGGQSKHTLTIGEMPTHSHSGFGGASFIISGGTLQGLAAGAALTNAATTDSSGSGDPHNIIQLTALVKKYIRYQ